MAKKLDYSVISPSLLENITIHRTSPRLSLGIMEESESYFKSLEQNTDDVRLDASVKRSLSPRIRATLKSRSGPSSECMSLQPRPQPAQTNNEVLLHKRDQLPAKKSRSSKLTKAELEDLSKPCVPKNTETSTKWAVENFYSWMSQRNESSDEKCPPFGRYDAG